MYQPLADMEILRLSGNGLHTLDPNLFEHLPYLRVLTLDSNPFGVIDHGTLIALANIPKLEVSTLISYIIILSHFPILFLKCGRLCFCYEAGTQ